MRQWDENGNYSHIRVPLIYGGKPFFPAKQTKHLKGNRTTLCALLAIGENNYPPIKFIEKISGRQWPVWVQGPVLNRLSIWRLLCFTAIFSDGKI
jgi:hypothetical protein